MWGQRENRGFSETRKMCGVIHRASWQGVPAIPRCIPLAWRSLGIEPHPHQRNVRRFIALKERAFLPLPENPPRPAVIARWTRNHERMPPWDPHQGFRARGPRPGVPPPGLRRRGDFALPLDPHRAKEISLSCCTPSTERAFVPLGTRTNLPPVGSHSHKRLKKM
jgi:hypothetical protein